MNSPELHPSRAGFGPRAVRSVRIGGVPKEELLDRLLMAGFRLNDAARVLLADERFNPSPTPTIVEILEVSVAELGLPGGATFSKVVEHAAKFGLSLCPLELGPHLRLQLTDQPEIFHDQPAAMHRAPPGSLTIASAPLAGDDETPTGFYLRRIEGALWLRGYRSSACHPWSAHDVFVFSRSHVTPKGGGGEQS